MNRPVHSLVSILASCLCTVLAGCSLSPTLSKVPVAGGSFQGRVQGGQQPVTGANIQLYAVGTTGDGSAATALLKTPVVTDSSGNFSITGDYTCPAGATLVYLAATGGNPGLKANTNNGSLALLAALGQCGTLSSTTYIVIDELTTLGSLAPLYPYMTSVSALGSGPSDASAFSTAFTASTEFTDTASGSVPGPNLPTGFYASQTEINSIGDILASCINTAGGASGDGSPCGTLFSLTTPVAGATPTDTVSAALEILKNPTYKG